MTTHTNNPTRIEADSIGQHAVPVDAYYGVQSLRARENFPITGQSLHPRCIQSLAYVKKACAITNQACHRLSEDVAQAIVQACDEIINHQLQDAFIVDPIQGGAGTSMNMNINEVLANRAIEILGGQKGNYQLVHPNDHVNYGQSTNDVIPTAGTLTTYQLAQDLIQMLIQLEEALLDKAQAFDDIIKMGRTQMQDAIPIRLGQEFHAYATAIKRSRQRLENALDELLTVNLGATAIGTGLNADEHYFTQVVPELAKVSGLPVHQAEDMIDGTQHIDSFAYISSILKTLALALSKISNDLRLMSSGPKTGFNEINLPKKQNGSSIMPGKVNPVIPEVVNQVAFKVCGNDLTIAMAVEAGQLELNAFEPVTFFCLFESLTYLKQAIQTLIDNCLKDLTANRDRCHELVEQSVGTITALVPYIGYQAAADIAKEALTSDQSVKELVIEKGLLDQASLDHLLQAEKMTTPGICQA